MSELCSIYNILITWPEKEKIETFSKRNNPIAWNFWKIYAGFQSWNHELMFFALALELFKVYDKDNVENPHRNRESNPQNSSWVEMESKKWPNSETHNLQTNLKWPRPFGSRTPFRSTSLFRLIPQKIKPGHLNTTLMKRFRLATFVLFETVVLVSSRYECPWNVTALNRPKWFWLTGTIAIVSSIKYTEVVD